MKHFFRYSVILLALSSCNNNPKIDSGKISYANSDATHYHRLCFEHLEGNNKQDTTKISLFIEGDQVSGSFNSIPAEKDSRKGSIKGTINGNIIKGIWSYMQEGVNDTLSVEFKLSDNELLQKTMAIDKTTGRQKLTDTSSFSIPYLKIKCE